MNKRRLSKLWTIAILVIAGSVLAAAARQEGTVFAQVKPKPEKLCPITFHLDPPTLLQAHFAAGIERTNAKLAQDLVSLRHDRALNDEKLRAGLAGEFEKAYAGTYLAFPVLWDETGVPHTGWYQVLTYLATVFPKATFIQPQTVNVYLEYLPLAARTSANLEKKLQVMMKKRGATKLWFDPGTIDFLATIRTVLAYAPYDDPLQLGNESPTPHQNLCDPIY